MSGKPRSLRRTLLVLSGLGVAHFAISLVAWAAVLTTAWYIPATPRPDIVPYLLTHAGPAVALCGVFLAAFVLVWKNRRRAVLVLAIAVVASMGAFAWDTHYDRYQIQTLTLDQGCKHVYCTWWWWEHDR